MKFCANLFWIVRACLIVFWFLVFKTSIACFDFQVLKTRKQESFL